MDIIGVNVTLLLLAGIVAGAVAAIAIAAYSGVFRSVKLGSSKAASTVDTQVTQLAKDSNVKENETSDQVRMDEAESASIPSVQEAPPPFPEESLTPSSTTMPTDITSVAVSSVAASASPFLVIATPKRRTRSSTKRLPTTSAAGPTRRRRSPKQPKLPEATIRTTMSTTPSATTAPANLSETTNETGTSQQEA